MREAILELLCRPLPSGPDSRRAPVDKRRGTAGLGSSLNVFLTQALQLMRKGVGVDASKYVIRDSEHGAIFNRTRCPTHSLACLFRGFTHPCSAPGAPAASRLAAAPERAAAIARIRSAHPYAVANELARLAFRPNAWLAPQVRAMEEAVGGRADIAVHVRRGDKFLQELGVACPTCTKSKTATRREHIVQPRNGGDWAAIVLAVARHYNATRHAHREGNAAGGGGGGGGGAALRVLVLSDDPNAPDELVQSLPPNVHVVALMTAPPPPRTPVSNRSVAASTPERRAVEVSVAVRAAERAAEKAGEAAAQSPQGQPQEQAQEPGGEHEQPGPRSEAQYEYIKHETEEAAGGEPAESSSGELRHRHAWRQRLAVHSFAHMELGAFLVGGMTLMGQASVVVANSGSNLGGLLFTLASTQEPRLWDLDGHLGVDALTSGLYFCDIEWGGRHGVCSASQLANRRSMLFA